MSANPRRTAVPRPSSLNTNILRKAATFHSPVSPCSEEDTADFRPPSLPQRSQTNLDDVVGAHRRRAALTIDNVEKAFAAPRARSDVPRSLFRDHSSPVPRGVLNHTLPNTVDANMSTGPEPGRRVLRPRNRRTNHHASDSGLGSSIASTVEKPAKSSLKKEKSTAMASTVTRSAAARSASTNLPGLSERAANRICEHTLKPLLANRAFKDMHPLLLECPRKMRQKEIVCLRDVEKTLLFLAPEKTKSAGLYLEFCQTTIRCIQATVEYLGDREQTRPRDPPYTKGYFIDLVDQIQQYAQELADAAKKEDEGDEMDVDPTDEIKLHGGIHINGQPAELVRVKKNGQAISLATGEPVDMIEEEAKGSVRFKRSASQVLEDEEEIMRSMARRKKNASPEELAPKRCREAGCHKEFKRACDLTKHEKTHSRPWKCPVPTCKYHEYGWPTEKEMDRHHNDKHSSNPAMYECLFKPCPYKSKRDSNRKQHMEKAHGWTYVRTKTNPKKSDAPSIQGSATEPTPQLQNIPTPTSDHSVGVTTPSNDYFNMYNPNNIEFPEYIPNDALFSMIPQDIKLDYSLGDNNSPASDSELDFNSTYHDISNDFTHHEDIYSATARIPTPSLPTPVHDYYQKDFALQFPQFPAAGMCQPQPASHISPIGQGNAMLFTPTSLAEVDEGFDEHQDFGTGKNYNHNDFVLFPAAMDASKTMLNEPHFPSEIPSVMAGFSQPNSQDLLGTLTMDWPQFT